MFEASKSENYQNLQKHSNFKIISIKKKKITFTSKELDLTNAAIQSLKEKYLQKQRQLEESIIMEVTNYIPPIEVANFVFVEQDIFHAFSKSFQNPKSGNVFCFPEFISEGENQVELTDSWHLVLKECVANDVFMKEGVQDFLLITGPNMGGKSTFIRQVAVAIILAHIGAPVPASKCKLSVFSSVFTRTGASDDQTEGRSTFMNEMVDAANMLLQMDKNSFVIIDELGRGTSVYEGLGLSQAICEYILTQKKSFCLFATHFQELTSLQQSYPSFKNYHLEVDERGEELAFTYKVLSGVASRSYGIEIIKKLRFPQIVIESAEEVLKKYEA